MDKLKHAFISAATLLVLVALAVGAATLLAAPTGHSQTAEKEPFHRTLNFDMPDGTSVRSRNFTVVLSTGSTQVPSGKRLVVEHVSGSAELPTGQTVELQINYFVRNSTIGDAKGLHYFAPHHNQADGAQDRYVLSQPAKIYASQESGLSVTAQRNSATGTAYVSMNISGYVEDEP